MKEELLKKISEYQAKLGALGRYLWLNKKIKRDWRVRRYPKRRELLARYWKSK